MAYKKNRQVTNPDRLHKSFTVGDGVSWGYNGDSYWGYNGDSYPGTILFVSDSGRKVLVSKDQYKVIDGLGGYVEGSRTCEFTTIQRSKEECEEWTLYADGFWRMSPGKGFAWTLKLGRSYSSNETKSMLVWQKVATRFN